jgi:hypothetical protein
MLAANPFDTQLIDLFKQVTTALIEFTPPHFKTISCKLTSGLEDGQEALFYEISSPDFPDEGTTDPSERLHEAATRLVRHWKQEGESFPGLLITMSQTAGGSWTNSITRLDPAEDLDDLCNAERARVGQAAGSQKPWWKFW